jgi:hypothetical protein
LHENNATWTCQLLLVKPVSLPLKVELVPQPLGAS